MAGADFNSQGIKFLLAFDNKEALAAVRQMQKGMQGMAEVMQQVMAAQRKAFDTQKNSVRELLELLEKGGVVTPAGLPKDWQTKRQEFLDALDKNTKAVEKAFDDSSEAVKEFNDILKKNRDELNNTKASTEELSDATDSLGGSLERIRRFAHSFTEAFTLDRAIDQAVKLSGQLDTMAYRYENVAEKTAQFREELEGAQKSTKAMTDAIIPVIKKMNELGISTATVRKQIMDDALKLERMHGISATRTTQLVGGMIKKNILGEDSRSVQQMGSVFQAQMNADKFGAGDARTSMDIIERNQKALIQIQERAQSTGQSKDELRQGQVNRAANIAGMTRLLQERGLGGIADKVVSLAASGANEQNVFKGQLANYGIKGNDLETGFKEFTSGKGDPTKIVAAIEKLLLTVGKGGARELKPETLNSILGTNLSKDQIAEIQLNLSKGKSVTKSVNESVKENARATEGGSFLDRAFDKEMRENLAKMGENVGANLERITRSLSKMIGPGLVSILGTVEKIVAKVADWMEALSENKTLIDVITKAMQIFAALAAWRLIPIALMGMASSIKNIGSLILALTSPISTVTSMVGGLASKFLAAAAAALGFFRASRGGPGGPVPGPGSPVPVPPGPSSPVPTPPRPGSSTPIPPGPGGPSTPVPPSGGGGGPLPEVNIPEGTKTVKSVAERAAQTRATALGASRDTAAILGERAGRVAQGVSAAENLRAGAAYGRGTEYLKSGMESLGETVQAGGRFRRFFTSGAMRLADLGVKIAGSDALSEGASSLRGRIGGRLADTGLKLAQMVAPGAIKNAGGLLKYASSVTGSGLLSRIPLLSTALEGVNLFSQSSQRSNDYAKTAEDQALKAGISPEEAKKIGQRVSGSTGTLSWRDYLRSGVRIAAGSVGATVGGFIGGAAGTFVGGPGVGNVIGGAGGALYGASKASSIADNLLSKLIGATEDQTKKMEEVGEKTRKEIEKSNEKNKKDPYSGRGGNDVAEAAQRLKNLRVGEDGLDREQRAILKAAKLSPDPKFLESKRKDIANQQRIDQQAAGVLNEVERTMGPVQRGMSTMYKDNNGKVTLVPSETVDRYLDRKEANKDNPLFNNGMGPTPNQSANQQVAASVTQPTPLSQPAPNQSMQGAKPSAQYNTRTDNITGTLNYESSGNNTQYTSSNFYSLVQRAEETKNGKHREWDGSSGLPEPAWVKNQERRRRQRELHDRRTLGGSSTPYSYELAAYGGKRNQGTVETSPVPNQSTNEQLTNAATQPEAALSITNSGSNSSNSILEERLKKNTEDNTKQVTESTKKTEVLTKTLEELIELLKTGSMSFLGLGGKGNGKGGLFGLGGGGGGVGGGGGGGGIFTTIGDTVKKLFNPSTGGSPENQPSFEPSKDGKPGSQPGGQQPDFGGPVKGGKYTKAPEKIEALIQEAAQKYNIPPDLLRAQMRQESGFKNSSVSNKGAGGLMQLMPGTAKELGLTQEDVADPYKNVMAGSKYLKQQLDRFKGNIPLALAAYNAGPGNVAKYGNTVPPFKETQDYVRKITGEYNTVTQAGGIDKLNSGQQGAGLGGGKFGGGGAGGDFSSPNLSGPLKGIDVARELPYQAKIDPNDKSPMGDLTRHFNLKDFASKDGAKMPPEMLAKIKMQAERLEVIREAAGGKNIRITSGYRSPGHNEAIRKRGGGAAKDSQHTHATATDFNIEGMSPKETTKIVEGLIEQGKLPAGGLGEYDRWVHYDGRDSVRGARWSKGRGTQDPARASENAVKNYRERVAQRRKELAAQESSSAGSMPWSQADMAQTSFTTKYGGKGAKEDFQKVVDKIQSDKQYTMKAGGEYVLSPENRDKAFPQNMSLDEAMMDQSIPKMKHGGIAGQIVGQKTLAVIGEAGPEAVVPLRHMGDLGNAVSNLSGAMASPNNAKSMADSPLLNDSGIDLDAKKDLFNGSMSASGSAPSSPEMAKVASLLQDMMSGKASLNTNSQPIVQAVESMKNTLASTVGGLREDIGGGDARRSFYLKRLANGA